jgi:hypothetical protein
MKQNKHGGRDKDKSTSKSCKSNLLSQSAKVVERQGTRRNSTEVLRKIENTLDVLAEKGSEPEGWKKKTKASSRPATKKITAKSVKGAVSKIHPNQTVVQSEDSEWVRAIGFEAADDFNLLWKEPLEESIKRSMSMPALSKERFKVDAKQVFGEDEDEDTTKEDKPRIEYVSSEPGLLRTRIELPSFDRTQQIAFRTRLRQLMNDEVTSSEITNSLSKHLRKQGYLLPQYGIHVSVKKSRLHSQRSTLQSSRTPGELDSEPTP